jgi:hypothetical protein
MYHARSNFSFSHVFATLLLLLLSTHALTQSLQHVAATDGAFISENPEPSAAGFSRVPNAVEWRDGAIAYGGTVDCITGVAQGVGTYVGQLIETSNFSQPTVGQRFYIRIGAAALAAPCAGSFLGVFFAPPQGVSVDAVPTYKTRCFSKAPSQNNLTEFTQGCPQPPYSVQAVPGGTAFGVLNPSASSGAWPFPFGAAYEFWIPVISSRTMNGLNTTPGIQLNGALLYIDGVTSPWVNPQFSMYLAPGAPTADPIFRNGFE